MYMNIATPHSWSGASCCPFLRWRCRGRHNTSWRWSQNPGVQIPGPVLYARMCSLCPRAQAVARQKKLFKSQVTLQGFWRQGFSGQVKLVCQTVRCPLYSNTQDCDGESTADLGIIVGTSTSTQLWSSSWVSFSAKKCQDGKDFALCTPPSLSEGEVLTSSGSAKRKAADDRWHIIWLDAQSQPSPEWLCCLGPNYCVPRALQPILLPRLPPSTPTGHSESFMCERILCKGELLA